MTKAVIKVVFRVDADGDVLALFPDEIADSQGHCVCYQHMGQHGAASYRHCIDTSRAATVEEYRPLAEELRQIGYQLQIRRRSS